MKELTGKVYPTISQGFGIAGIVVAGMILFVPIIFLENIIGKQISGLLYYLFAVSVPFWLIFTIRKKKTGIDHLTFIRFNPIIIPLLMIGAIAIALGLSLPIICLIPVPEFLKDAFFAMGSDRGVCAFITIVIIAPLFEEFIFRGIVLEGFLKRYSPAKSIIVSSVLFGVVHLNPWQFASALFVGCFMGWIYYRSHSLWLTIIIHASLNLFSFLSSFVMTTSRADMDKTLVQTYGGITNLIITLFVSWIAIVVSVHLLNKYFNREDQVVFNYSRNNVPSLNE